MHLRVADNKLKLISTASYNVRSQVIYGHQRLLNSSGSLCR